MDTQQVTVVTVVLNGALTIEDTLRSVRGQRDIRVEHIVVDGGSTDGTLDIVRRSQYKPDLLISEPDMGVYDAMNSGIAVAKGEYLGFLNADDFLASDTSLSDLLTEA